MEREMDRLTGVSSAVMRGSAPACNFEGSWRWRFQFTGLSMFKPTPMVMKFRRWERSEIQAAEMSFIWRMSGLSFRDSTRSSESRSKQSLGIWSGCITSIWSILGLLLLRENPEVELEFAWGNIYVYLLNWRWRNPQKELCSWKERCVDFLFRTVCFRI